MINDIVLAGLLHDVGKFAERGDPAHYEDLSEAPRFHYNHAAATLKFLERHVKYQGREPLWFRYASMHHKPSDSEPIEWIVAEADRLSSGMDRQTYAAEERATGKQKFTTPLKPITEFVSLKEADPINGEYFVPLHVLAAQKEAIFPKPMSELPDLKAQYAALYEQFCKEFDELVAYGIENKTDTLYFLLQKYWWAVPSSVRKSDFPDISLFEHSKTTAALAGALYLYHQADNSLNNPQSIQNRRPQKFRLFVGDVGGIQNFIYQISSKGAYSQLKGRSFYIQIINDLIAEFLVQKAGLQRPNIIYSNGGKFYLLLPNIPETLKLLEEAVQSVNRTFFKTFDGQVFLRSASAPLSGEDLHLSTGRLAEKWQEVNNLLAEHSLRPFDFMIEQTDKYYETIFAPQGSGQSHLCASCHREMDHDVTENTALPLCRTCLKMKKWGERLKSAHFMVISSEAHKTDDDHYLDAFLGQHILFYDTPESLLNRPWRDGDRVFLFNSTDWSPVSHSDIFRTFKAKEMLGVKTQPVVQLGFKFYGGTIRFDATFDEIAKRAQGNFKKLGILRMDVDNLGSLFRKGLRYYRVKVSEAFNEKFRPRKNFYSISRMTTLSAQLNLFFSGYLNQLILPETQTDRQRAAIVYAGGDDLFIVGSWDAALDSAIAIRRAFREFTCHNPAFTISGGLVITGGKFPIYKSAEYAGQAEELSKHHRQNAQSKNSLTFFGVPLFWDDVFMLEERKNDLLNLIQQAPTNRSFLQHLRRIANEYLTIRAYYQQKRYKESEIRRLIRHERWLWRMVYDLSRYREKNKSLAHKATEYEKTLSNTTLNQEKPFIEFLPVLVQWVDYLTRNEK